MWPSVTGFSQNWNQNFHFLRQSHSPRMPGLTHPQGNQGNIWEFLFYFHFLIKFNPKVWIDFWLRWLFPQFQYATMIMRARHWEEWRPVSDSRPRTDFKVAKEEDQYWSCRHHQVLLVYQLTHLLSISIFVCLTWKYISLSHLSYRQSCYQDF